MPGKTLSSHRIRSQVRAAIVRPAILNPNAPCLHTTVRRRIDFRANAARFIAATPPPPPPPSSSGHVPATRRRGVRDISFSTYVYNRHERDHCCYSPIIVRRNLWFRRPRACTGHADDARVSAEPRIY